MGAFVKTVYDRTLKYTSYETSTKLQTFYNDELLFPAVTVCSSNLFDKHKMEQEDIFVQNVISK